MKLMSIEETLVRVKNAMKISEYNLAEGLLKKIISLKPDFFLPYMLLGNVYERTGRVQKALRLYKQSIQIKPDNVEALNNLGIAYKNTKKYEKALAFLNRALLLDPHRADIYYNLGNVYKETGNPEKAIFQYEKSIEINSGFVPAYNNLGTVLEQLGENEKAGQVYELGLEVDSNNPKLHYNLGIIYEKKNKLEQAKLEFVQALKVKPGWNDALLNLGIVLSKLTEHNKSIDTFLNILKLDPGNVKAINNLGIEYSKLKNIEKAKSFYRKALDLDPDYKKAHLNLGTLLEDQGEYTEALVEIENLVKKNPEDIPARFRLGNIYTAMGKYRQAENQFRFILKHSPNHGETLRALGNLYLRIGKYNAANNCYNQLSKTHTGAEDYHLDFAVLLNDREKFEKSEVEVKKFLSSNPDDIDARSLLGELYFKQGFLENAAELFEEIIKKNPNIVKPYYYLAKTYKKIGDSGKAVETIDKLITLQGTRQTHTDMENINKAINLYETATKEYEKDFKVTLNKNIARLDDFSFDEGGNEKSREDPDSLYTADDTDTIMKTGGAEPILYVKEEVEQIKIIEVEQKPPPIIEIKDSEPPPLTDLLNNQVLYENLLEMKENQVGQVHIKKQIKDSNGMEDKKAPPSIKRGGMEKKELPDDMFYKEHKAMDTKNISSDIFDSIAKKLDNLVNDKSALNKSDNTNETLLDVLKNISRALKEKGQTGGGGGPFPAFYLPMQKKRRPQRKRRKKKDNKTGQELGPHPTKKNKTTREKLREFFHNVRKKLNKDENIKIPGDVKKQEYINNLVKQISETNPFEENRPEQEAVKKNNELIKEMNGIIKEPEYLTDDKKTDMIDITVERVKEDDADMFISNEPLQIGSIDPQNELIFEEEVTQKESNISKQKTGIQADSITIQNKQLNEKKSIILKDNQKEKDQKKSFKPRIRLKRKSISRRMVVNTLQFLRRLIDSIPGIGLNTGIKSKLDNLLKKIIK